jgi:hypothetical protein
MSCTTESCWSGCNHRRLRLTPAKRTDAELRLLAGLIEPIDGEGAEPSRNPSRLRASLRVDRPVWTIAPL